MKLIEEALKIIEETVKHCSETERIPLMRAFGRVLAEDVKSDMDMPPFNRSAMDGYAVVSSDGAGEYEVCDYIPAGGLPAKSVGKGQVARIMTGAPVPEGADAVIQVEKTGGFVAVGEKAVIKESVKPGANISPKGEDVKIGDTVLTAGTLIGPPEAAVLASAGADPVSAYRLPTAAILSTGDELLEPCEKPGPGKIRNSNAYSLCAQFMSMGVVPDYLGAAKDDEDDLRKKIARGTGYDFLVVSGGVSAGDKDFAPKILTEAGYSFLFEKVKIKPGKPLVFGVSTRNKYVFGTPGNPVSTTVSFEVFIKAALRRFMGLQGRAPLAVKAVLAAPFKRKNADREEYIPTKLGWEDSGFVAKKLAFHGSAHIGALTEADAFFKVPAGVNEMQAGETVEARFFRSFV